MVTLDSKAKDAATTENEQTGREDVSSSEGENRSRERQFLVAKYSGEGDWRKIVVLNFGDFKAPLLESEPTGAPGVRGTLFNGDGVSWNTVPLAILEVGKVQLQHS